MNILVINGSPKGEYSITLQTVLYIEKHFPEHDFHVLHAGKQIRALEKDFSEAAELLKNADLILFSYPVYTFIAPSQLHRFIELMKMSGVDVKNKFATQITTSKHFYDVTAHKYIEENCQDMAMKFIPGLSADMDDLLTSKGQAEAIAFFKHILWSVCTEVYVRPPKKHKLANYIPVCMAENRPKSAGTIALVADLAGQDTQLKHMIERFEQVMPCQIKLINIHDFHFSNGCVSCFNCATDGTCIFKDGFSDLLRNEIQTCSAIVLAFSIKDHSMGSVFKTYDDRQFCNGHRTVTMGMPFGYLVSGNYSEENNLRMIIEGRAQVGGNYLAGVATDEFDPNGEIDQLAANLQYAIELKYTQPSNFLGVGGMKIFRDLIWQMQGMMKADHRFYKAHNQYDFPQKHPITMLKMYLVGALISNPKLKKKMGNKMNEGMIAPYKKVLK